MMLLARRQFAAGTLGAMFLAPSAALATPSASAPRTGPYVAADGKLKLKVFHLFDGGDGISKIDIIEFDPVAQTTLEGTPLDQSRKLNFVELFESKAVEVNVTAAPPGYFIDWHHAARRHFFVNVQGTWETGLGDGSKHLVGPGDFLLAEDRKGRGHTSRVVSEGWAVAMDVVLEG